MRERTKDVVERGGGVTEMKRQKLDVEQTIETSKKSLCEETFASAQQNRQDHATKGAPFAKMLQKKEVLYRALCGLEERLQNEYKALLNLQYMF